MKNLQTYNLDIYLYSVYSKKSEIGDSEVNKKSCFSVLQIVYGSNNETTKNQNIFVFL